MQITPFILVLMNGVSWSYCSSSGTAPTSSPSTVETIIESGGSETSAATSPNLPPRPKSAEIKAKGEYEVGPGSKTQEDSGLSLSVGKVLRDLEESIRETEMQSYPEVAANGSVDNETRLNKPKTRLSCIPVNRTTENQVLMLKSTELQTRLGEESSSNVTNRTQPSTCSITFFYASWCQFSAQAAPFYNAIPKHFPGINFYAVDALNNQNTYNQFGVIALPTILIHHNGRHPYRYNHTEHNLEKYRDFITHLTGMQPLNFTEETDISPDDQKGPVPTTVVKTFNYNLLLATLFLVGCALLELSKSAYFNTILDNLRNAWREAEIQHEHVD